jgi:hypothetical protein
MTIRVSLFTIALFACSEAPPYDLHITGRGMTLNANLHVGIVQQLDQVALVGNEWTPIDKDSVDITYGSVLARGVAYRVYVWEDANDDGHCTSSDRVWRADIAAASGPTTVDLGTLAQDPTVCTYFAGR